MAALGESFPLDLLLLKLLTRFIFLFLSCYLKMYWRCVKHHPSSLPLKEVFIGVSCSKSCSFRLNSQIPKSIHGHSFMCIPKMQSQNINIPDCGYFFLYNKHSLALIFKNKNWNGHFGVNLNINSEKQVEEVTTFINLLSSLSLL